MPDGTTQDVASGGVVLPQTNGFRLTLTTGVPVTTADVTGATTCYLTPYTGNYIALYDGTNWQNVSSAEVSLALGTLASGANYDVFAYKSGTAVVLELSAAWTNDTTRADALATQNGVQVKNADKKRRLVGTLRTTSTTTTEDSNAKRFLWNASNGVRRCQRQIDTTASWVVSNTANWVTVNAGNSNWKNEMVLGDAGVLVHAFATTQRDSTNGGLRFGIALDQAGAGALVGVNNGMQAASQYSNQALTTWQGYPGLGYHYLQGLQGQFTANTTMYGGATVVGSDPWGNAMIYMTWFTG